MGPGPAPEPRPAVAWVSAAARGAPEVCLFMSPRPSFSSAPSRPPWPTGLQVNPGGTREPVLVAFLPLNGGFCLAGLTPSRIELVVVSSCKPVFMISIHKNIGHIC